MLLHKYISYNSTLTLSDLFSIASSVATTLVDTITPIPLLLKNSVFPTPLNELTLPELVTLSGKHYTNDDYSQDINDHVGLAFINSNIVYSSDVTHNKFIKHEAFGSYSVVSHDRLPIGLVEQFYDETPYLVAYVDPSSMARRYPKTKFSKLSGDYLLSEAKKERAGIILEHLSETSSSIAIIDPQVIPALCERTFISRKNLNKLYYGIMHDKVSDVEHVFKNHPHLHISIYGKLRLEHMDPPVTFIPIIAAAQYGSLHVLTYFIETLKADINTLDTCATPRDKIENYDFQHTLFDVAIAYDKKNVANYLRSKGGMTYYDYERETSSSFYG